MNWFARSTGAGFERGLVAVALLIATLPYVIAFLTAPAGHVYTWLLPPYPEDSLAYLAWSRQALNGEIVFRLKYTAAPHEPLLFQPFFYVAGLLGRLTRLDLGIVHLLLKTIGILLFFRAVFGLLKVLEVPQEQARMSAVLVAVSSGVGGLLAWSLSPEVLAALNPADLWLVDINIFWSLLWSPLFPFSLALIVYCIRWIVEGVQSQAFSGWWKAGLATALLALIHPYHVPMLYLFFAISVASRVSPANWLRPALWYLGLSVPVVAYVTFQSGLHPLLADHAITGRMDSPLPIAVVLGCGLLLAGAATAVVQDRPRFARIWPLSLWAGLCLVLAYSPLWFQRKFLFGLQLPLCILTAFVMVKVFRPTWRWVGVGILATTPIYLMHSQYQELHDLSPTNPYYVREELIAALSFLRETSDPDAVVFASYEVSRLVPAVSGNTVIWGHWAQSVDLRETLRILQPVFAENSHLGDAERIGRFKELGIEYMIVDASLKTMLGGELPIWLSQNAQVVWRMDETEVLQFRP